MESSFTKSWCFGELPVTETPWKPASRPVANTLIAEVSNRVGAWWLFLRLEDDEGRPLRLHDDGTLEVLP